MTLLITPRLMDATFASIFAMRLLNAEAREAAEWKALADVRRLDCWRAWMRQNTAEAVS